MRRSIAITLAIPYLLILFYLTLFLSPNNIPATRHYWNLVPLRTILTFFRKGGAEMIVNNVGNLVAFMPAGFLLALGRGARRSALGATLAGLGLSLFIEVYQYFTCRRVADVDDVLLNTLGAAVGYAAYVGLERSLRDPAPAPARP